MRTLQTKYYFLAAIFSVVGCSAAGSDQPLLGSGGLAPGGNPGAGGSSGGTQNPATGGSVGPSAGAGATSTGGTSNLGTGGAPASTGGSPTGGTPAGTGGIVGNGGTPGNGGAAPANGGTPSSSGGAAGGRGPGSGGATSSTGGDSSGMGGRGSGRGGNGSGAGGGNATGGSAAAGAPSGSCSEANKTLSNNATGKHCGYTYEYWKDSGSGSLVLKTDGFSVDWSNINNLLGRKGIRPGTKDNVVTYESNYQPNGNSYLCVYGWTQNPLVEYYIVDSWGTWRPPGGQGLQGTVSCDGATYDIYKTQRVNQPSIEGNKTFWQYWSVRQQKRTSGTITVSCHFNAWESKGMNMGGLYEVSMTVEGYQSSGKADVKMSMK